MKSFVFIKDKCSGDMECVSDDTVTRQQVLVYIDIGKLQYLEVYLIQYQTKNTNTKI